MFEIGEINSSTAYRLASQVVVPRLQTEVFPAKGLEPFRLTDDIYAILDDEVARGNLTQGQLDSTCRVNLNGGNVKLARLARFYAQQILKSSGEILSTDTKGMYILALTDTEQDEELEEAESTTGSIYAYSFPSHNGSMIKIGKASGNVQDRINQQLGAANPEAPVILQTWPVADIGVMETAIHSILKARGKWVEAPRAKEWFRTSVEEVETIIKFIKGGLPQKI